MSSFDFPVIFGIDALPQGIDGPPPGIIRPLPPLLERSWHSKGTASCASKLRQITRESKKIKEKSWVKVVVISVAIFVIYIIIHRRSESSSDSGQLTKTHNSNTTSSPVSAMAPGLPVKCGSACLCSRKGMLFDGNGRVFEFADKTDGEGGLVVESETSRWRDGTPAAPYGPSYGDRSKKCFWKRVLQVTMRRSNGSGPPSP